MTATTKQNTKVSITRNYRLFARSAENRPFDERKHRKLYESMKRYGFLACFPIVCTRNGDKHLIVKDGQHRLDFAEKLNLPVYWMEESVDFDVAFINSTPKIWVLRDFAQKYSAQGVAIYHDGLEFADRYGLPIGTAFALLGGTTSFGNVQATFMDGTFRAKDRKWADAVAVLYSGLVSLSRDVRNARMIEACMAACRVLDFDADRLLQNAKRCREKLVAYSNRDSYLDMLEEVYNFGRSKLVGLKAAATQAMRERNAANVKAQAKKAKADKVA